ncbi:MAG: lamin tail domain-containing protein, partial [Flavisolibacter sp.]
MPHHVLTIVIITLFLHNSTAQVAKRFDILITEIFPDPTPSVGLPISEYIEIKNVSTVPYNLHDWKISDGNSTSVISGNYLLLPDSIVVICSNSAAQLYMSFANVIGVSAFPSLDNDADLVYLRSSEGRVIHAISYTKEWYQNDLKTDGGWSLEMVDLKNPCAGITNWMASTQLIGGTPGKDNSVQNKNPDNTGPLLLRTYTTDSNTIVAVFDESLDSAAASNPEMYTIDNIEKPRLANPIAPLFREIILQFPQHLLQNTVYHLTVSGITDCVGNENSVRKVKCGLTQVSDTGDIVINEILFNPKTDGYDFIELYNKSKKILDLQHLYIANRNSTGSLINVHQICTFPYLLFPGDFVVFTENAKWLTRNFSMINADNLLELQALPSLPDDNG